jgi:hypothetical protein
MDRITSGHACRSDDVAHVQITVLGRGWTDAYGLVGHIRMQRSPIGFRIDRDSPDPHLLASADDPHSYLTAIRDQQGSNHKGFTSKSG